MSESPTMMVIHGGLFALLAYFVMIYLLKQPAGMAEKHSVMIGLLVAMYMVLFGHKLPKL